TGGWLVGVRPAIGAATVEINSGALIREFRILHAGGEQVFAIEVRVGTFAPRGVAGMRQAEDRDVGMLLDAQWPTGRLIAKMDRVGAQRISVGQHPVVGAHIGINDVHAGPAWQRSYGVLG